MYIYFPAKRSLLICFLFFCCGALSAQRLDSLLANTEARFPQEKIYLQYDKPYYNPGETVWFKMYILPTNFPTTMSGTGYAELLDDKGTILQRKIMPLFERGAASGFELPDSIKNTVLYVRAYTAWMLNFDSSLQYLKPLRIISKAVGKPAKVTDTYTLTFFPEGGDMIADVPNRVAFKASNQDGIPVKAEGSITDAKGTKVTTFFTTHDGMGYCTFSPAANEKYKAVWKDKKTAQHETILPQANTQGVALTVTNNADALTYTIERPEAAEEDFKSFYIVAKMQQSLAYSARINLANKTKITAPIPTDNLADGIMQVTIFNAKQIPVAERMVFINHNNYSFATDLHSVELNLGKRKRNVLQVDVGDTTLTNLSIAVTDESLATPGLSRESIFSQMLLTSDVKGNVYNPAQYFLSDEDSVRQQLDLVMMTNAWRRLQWQDVVAGNLPAIRHAPEGGLSISGTVYGPSKLMLKGRSLSGILKTKSGGGDFMMMPVEQDGSFKAENIYIFDTAKLYYQFNADKDKKLTESSSFTFNPMYVKQPGFFPVLLSGITQPAGPDSARERKNLLLADQLRQQFFEGNRIKELGTVVVKAKIKSPEQKMDEEYTSGFFSGGDGYTFLTENDPLAKSALTVLDYLKSKVAGMQVNTSGTPSITWRGSATSVFLNESTADLGTVQSISMNDVAMIKIFRPPFFNASSGGAGGAVAIYVKRGANTNDVTGLDFTSIAGYSVPREFYSPDYESAATVPVEHDLRSTLYWNPFLVFDRANRRIMIPFFNNDSSKKIRVIIEGVNRLGQLTREEKTFQ